VVTPDEQWLSAAWPFVRDNLPAAPAQVLEIGCGPLGGFVPELRTSGYRAIGIDPEAPEGADYRRVEFEQYAGSEPVDAIVASTSLHHVVDLGAALDKARAMLTPDGVIVILEWAREQLDEATARWCFDRLGTDDDGWLHERRAEWQASGEPWDACCRSWAEQEQMHTGEHVLRELNARFDRQQLDYGPYLFPYLDGVTEAEEQSAIDAGLIHATRIQYTGRPRTAAPAG
jgi:SAM-dependent methyltransferase